MIGCFTREHVLRESGRWAITARTMLMLGENTFMVADANGFALDCKDGI